MLCPSCGREIDGDAKYCPSCGSLVVLGRHMKVSPESGKIEDVVVDVASPSEDLPEQGWDDAEGELWDFADSDDEDDDGLAEVKPLKAGGAPDPAALLAKKDMGFPENGHEPDVVRPEAIASPRGVRIYNKLIYAVAAVVVLAIIGIGVLIALNPAPVYHEMDATQFPDPGVLAAVSGFDRDQDGTLSPDEAAVVESLTIDSAEKVSGLGVFPNLSKLKVGGNPKLIDLSDCPSVKVLDLSDDSITALDTALIPSVQSLNLHSTSVRELDLAPLADLVFLDIQSTPVQSIDVSANPKMKDLKCGDGVQVAGLEATQMHVYSVVSGYSMYVPSHGNSDALSVRVTSTFDVHNRLSSINYRGGSEAYAAQYSYDEAGNLVSMARTSGTDVLESWTLGYDDAGRLVKARDGVSGHEFAYRYAADGALAGCDETYPGAEGAMLKASRTLEYNEMGALVGITGDGAANLRYDYSGHLLSYEPAGTAAPAPEGEEGSGDEAAPDNTVGWTFEYDEEGRCVAASCAFGSGASFDEGFVYGDNGRIVGGSRSTSGYYRGYGDLNLSQLFPGISQSELAYDAAGRLVDVSVTRSSDGQADTCNITYRRFISASEYAPVGTCLTIADPLQVCAVDLDNWAWAPWTQLGMSRQGVQAPLVVFNLKELWAGINNPMGNRPAVAMPAEGEEGSEEGEAAEDEPAPTDPEMPGEAEEAETQAESNAVVQAAMATSSLIEATTGPTGEDSGAQGD